MRRRRALLAVGGTLTGTLAGCTSAARAFDTYRYERDAPVDGSLATPWPTLAHDARRSGYTPYLKLPSTTAAKPFSLAGQSTGIQPAFIHGMGYFGARRFDYPQDRVGPRPPGLRASDGRRGGWIFAENDPLASPTVVGDAIFVTSDGTTRALDRRDGTLCWEYDAGRSYPTASPTVVDGTVYTVGERLFALAARTGEVRWATDPLEYGPRGTAATPDGVFATTGGEWKGMVYRFDPETGQREWATSASDDVPVPPVLGELVYVVEANGRLRALDPTTGDEAWSRELGGRSSAMPAVAGETVYAVATNGDALRAFDASTGATRWKFEFEGERATGPTVAGNTVYLPTSDGNGGRINELEADTGTVLGSHGLPREPVASLVVGIGRGLITTRSPSSYTILYILERPEPE